MTLMTENTIYQCTN